MKKLLLAFVLLFITSLILAQPGDIKKGAGLLDVKVVTNQITAKLTPALSLNDDQKPQINDAVSEFLIQKTEILPFQNTDPATYTSKFNLLSGGLISKFKTILMAKQMTSFLGLKPKSSDTANVLRPLFY